MKIIYITSGTGSFLCGICLRDNALIAALRAMGHDAVLVPLYLPPITDEPNMAEHEQIFFGGVNVYLQEKLALFRKTPRFIDWFFDRPALLELAGKRAAMTEAKDLGPLTVSMLSGEEGRQAKELRRLVKWLAKQEKPDIVCLSNALLIGAAREIRRTLGVPLLCTLQGEDSFLDDLPEPWREKAWTVLSERAKEIDAFIGVSRYFGEFMAERMGLRDGQMRVILNGINLQGFEPASEPPNPPTVGFLARLCPAKGLHTLVDAFLLLKKKDTVPGLRLLVAGTMTQADVAYLDGMKSRLEQAGAAADAEFHPNVDRAEKLAFLRRLSVFSVPATYGEAFGLYVLESLASGVPVVQPRHGAFPELVQATGGGLLVRPDDPEALAEGLAHLLRDPREAARLGEQGRRAVLENFSVERMARDVVKLCEELGQTET